MVQESGQLFRSAAHQYGISPSDVRPMISELFGVMRNQNEKMDHQFGGMAIDLRRIDLPYANGQNHARFNGNLASSLAQLRERTVVGHKDGPWEYAIMAQCAHLGTPSDMLFSAEPFAQVRVGHHQASATTFPLERIAVDPTAVVDVFSKYAAWRAERTLAAIYLKR